MNSFSLGFGKHSFDGCDPQHKFDDLGHTDHNLLWEFIHVVRNAQNIQRKLEAE
jgi:hypothetical protein